MGAAPAKDTQPRLAKGVNLVGLAKMLKVYARQRPLDGLGPAARKAMTERVLVSNWYPLSACREMLDFTYVHMLGRDPEQALMLGLLGGKEMWGSMHRGFLRDEPIANLRAMTPAWPAYFNFGSLSVEPEMDGRAVRFTVHDYADAPEVHSMTIAGWHLAAAQLGGAPNAVVEVLRLPAHGDPEQVHRIRW